MPHCSVTASAYQMLRGAELVFGAVFATLFLKRKLNGMHYGGLALCVAGVLLVGAAGLLAGEGSATHAVSRREIARGMALIVASQAVQAGQITFEDYFMVRCACCAVLAVLRCAVLSCSLTGASRQLSPPPSLCARRSHPERRRTWALLP